MPSRLLATLILSLGCSLAHASPALDAMKSCLVNSASAQEKTSLVRWIFSTMGAHPDVSDLVRITEATRIELDQAIARLAENLLTERCRKETIAAVRADGQGAVSTGFKALGEAAAGGLMMDRSVAIKTTNYLRYLDNAKVAQVMIEATIPAK